MRVKDLIEELKNYDDGLDVCVVTGKKEFEMSSGSIDIFSVVNHTTKKEVLPVKDYDTSDATIYDNDTFSFETHFERKQAFVGEKREVVQLLVTHKFPI